MEINNIIYKMLKQTTDFLDEWKDDLTPFAKEYAEALVFKVRDILAVPLRNCDVGTAQEQIKRWENFCLEHHEQWKPGKSLTAIQICNCPCYEGNRCNYFIWSQMPYEEGGADE